MHYPDEEEFAEFLEAVTEEFHVMLDYQRSESCKTVREFEDMIYDQVLLGKFVDRVRDQIEDRLIVHLNRCIKGETKREITSNDKQCTQLELAREIGNGPWTSVYSAMCTSLAGVVPNLRYRLWAKILMWCVLFGQVALCIQVGMTHGAFTAFSMWIGMLVVSLYFLPYLPQYAPEPKTTLQDAFDRFIDGMEECHNGMSYTEMQFRFRRLFAAFYEVEDFSSVEGDTPFIVQ